MKQSPKIVAAILGMALPLAAAAAGMDWAAADQALGRKGAEQAGGVHRYSFPRSDLAVTVDGVAIKPAFALGGWVAFLPMGSTAMFMGDLVLTDTEISPVMQRLLQDGVQVTAIHNHFLRGSMPVWYMHIGGHGDPAKVAATLRSALALSKTPLVLPPPAQPPPLDLDTTALDRTLGYKGTPNGGVYQFSVPRAENISEAGMAVPLGNEVNPVLKALRQNGIEVTALHSHMVDESPRLYFMHFWANDDARKLAANLRAALDLTNVRRAP